MHPFLPVLPLLAGLSGVFASRPLPAVSSIIASLRSHSPQDFPGYKPTKIEPVVAQTGVAAAPPGPAACSYVYKVGTVPPRYQNFWMDEIPHQGVAAFNNNSNYVVYRNVQDPIYGAKGDGIHDDTAAINLAISSGGRVSPASGQTSTTTQAVVYFPPGIYRITGPIIDYYITQLIGDPNCLPVIKADASFNTNANPYMLDGLEYVSDNTPGHGLFRPTNTFWRQVRNFVFDTTNVSISQAIVGIHWPTAQATSLQNIVFNMSTASGTQHTGVFIESGSGGWMTDLVFHGGLYGMHMGNQQFSMRNLTFHNAVTAINQIWNWGWTYKNLNIYNCGTGIDMTNGGSNAINVDSVVVIDSFIKNTPIAFATVHSNTSSPPGAGALILENIQLQNVPVAVTGAGGTTTLAGTTGSMNITAYAQGHEYLPLGPKDRQGTRSSFPRPSVLLGGANGGYYEQSKPQYQNYTTASFLSVRTLGATGNGVTDDTKAVQTAINKAARMNKVLFFDAGTYLVTSTILIPAGSRIVGEAYAVIMSSGSTWANMNSPVPVVQVGNAGDTGVVYWSDMLLSTQGAQPGAILIQWNLASPSTTPSGMWDVHSRIGGFTGSNLQANNCPIDNTTTYTAANIRKDCIAAYMSIHIAPSASGLYMENNWFWTADHDVDAVPQDLQPLDQITVYTGRGMYVESTAGTIWMYGSAVEHHSKYQYQFANTKNIVLGAIQTETPYYQPNPNATIPFPTNATINDPVFPTTPFPGTVDIPNADAFGLRVIKSNPLLVYGAGLYSFFNNYDTACSDPDTNGLCQSRGFSVDKMSRVYLADLHTVGTREMITFNSQSDIAAAADNVGQAQFIDEIAIFLSSKKATS